ncbi:Lanthionine synthetase C-like protein [compost metagenome]
MSTAMVIHPSETAVKNKLSSIIREIDSKPFDELFQDHGIMRGAAGIALFRLYADRYLLSEENTALTDALISSIIDSIAQTKSYSFSDGIAGIGWFLNHIQKNELQDLGLDPLLNVLDTILENPLRYELERGNYDYITGSLGIALYYLGRDTEASRELVAYTIRKLEKQAHQITPESIAWALPEVETDEQSVYDLGLCHGNASILAFLLKTHEAGIEQEITQKLINGVVNYFLTIARETPEISGSYWPNLEDGRTGIKSRLAWCYGDVGIAITILRAGILTGNEEWREKAVEVLELNAKRRELKANQILDAGLCHGAAGLAFMFGEAGKLSQNAVLMETATYWLEQTLAFDTHPDGIAGYKTYFEGQNEVFYYPAAGFLEGVSGVGLGMIGILVPEASGWKECLFL